MSYANGTTNYNLPQTVGTDKRDWSDTNQAFADIDAALKAAADGASQAAEDITSLTTRVGTAEDDIVGLKAEDISLDGRLDTAEGAISTLQLQVPDVRGDLEDMIVAFNEATATSTHAYAIGDYFIYNDVLYKATAAIAIGDTIVPNTNCSATNVMTEFVSGAAAPTAADVSLAPITGMTADDVQEGIAELYSDLHKGSVYVTADGVKTFKALLEELHALIDLNKVDHKSILSIGTFNAPLVRKQSSELWFTSCIVTDNFSISTYKVGSVSATYSCTGSTPTFSSDDSYLWPNGTRLELFY